METETKYVHFASEGTTGCGDGNEIGCQANNDWHQFAIITSNLDKAKPHGGSHVKSTLLGRGMVWCHSMVVAHASDASDSSRIYLYSSTRVPVACHAWHAVHHTSMLASCAERINVQHHGTAGGPIE